VRPSVEGSPTRRSSRSPDRALRHDLEGLRAIAVVGVVVYHLKASWLPGGFVGVDVFFVLSGFFITSLLLREAATTGRVDLIAFWGRRARRLLPAAAVVMIATISAGYLFVDSIDAQRFAHDGLYAALFSVNWHYAILGTTYLADPDPSPLVHYWSLGVEEQFYFVWPVVLLVIAVVVARRRPAWLRGSVGTFALLASALSFLVAWHQTAGLQPFAYFATYARVWQLGLGALLATSAVALSRLPVPVRALARWTGVAAILGFYFFAPLDIIYPGWIAAVPTLGAGLIVLSGFPRADGGAVATSGDLVFYAMRSRISQLLGRYSYGWYLWHWPPLVLLPLIVHHPLSTPKLIDCGLISLAAAIVSYHVLEHPVRSSRVLMANRGRLSLVLGAAIVIASVVTAQMVTAKAEHKTAATTVKTAQGTAVVPSPGVAAAETNQTVADGCELGETTKGNAPECRYLPNTGKGDVVLIGDSHAAQWLPAVKSIAQSKGWGLRVWTRANCPFADVTKMISGAPNKACDNWRTNAVQRLTSERPSMVVVASYPPPGGPSEYDRTSGAIVHGDQALTLYEQGMSRELARLHSAGIATLLINDEPRFTELAPKCVLEHPGDLGACSEPESDSVHSTADRAAAKSVPGVHSLDLTDEFCSNGRCNQVVGSTLAYRDNNHLTHEMITALAPKLRTAMEQTAAD
jgi:peptidoglycan/LPS O-acetylase OafA/YrhL